MLSYPECHMSKYRISFNLTESVKSSQVIWKGLGVLALAAGLVVIAVVGLARLTVPDEPTFSEGFEEADENPEGSLDFVPTAIGGELAVTGAREGTISLQQGFGGRFLLESDSARLYFETNPLAIDQMSYDGLEFFPESDACEFTEGEHNEDLGIAAAQLVCEELADIRENGSISVEGYIAVPADLIVDIDLPDLGGTVRAGDQEWEVEDPELILGQPVFPGDEDLETGLSVFSHEVNAPTLFFAYNEASDTLSLTRIWNAGEEIDVDAGACAISTEELVVVNPETQYFAIDLFCESIDVAGQGQVSVEGSIVFKRTQATPIFEP